VAALASEADWVLVPEWPPEKGWEDVLCNKLAQVIIVVIFAFSDKLPCEFVNMKL
jgi:hypothetical protein